MSSARSRLSRPISSSLKNVAYPPSSCTADELDARVRRLGRSKTSATPWPLSVSSSNGESASS